MQAGLTLLIGLIILGIGSEALIRGAVTTAVAFGVSTLVVGLTVISIGTSAPELTVSLSAAIQGETEIAVGNVIGSNIANVLLVMGAMACLRPFKIEKSAMRDSWVMIVVSSIFVALALYGVISMLIGGMLVVGLISYIVYLYYTANDLSEVDTEENTLSGGLKISLPLVIVGLGGVIWGANLMVEGAVGLAEQWGISSGVIALGLVAVGTSLPELAVSAAASLRNQAGLAVGNIIGSNISNILLILGASALVHSLVIPEVMRARDIWVMMATALLALFIIWRGAMGRVMGVLFLVLYAGYMTLLFG